MATVRIYQRKATAFAKNQVTPLVDRTANKILTGARTLAPRGSHRSGSERPVVGPTLRASLHIRQQPSAAQVIRLIGSKAQWAATIHRGSKPHLIRAKTKKLTFRWERGTLLLRGRRRGRYRGALLWFRFDRVSHPGNRRPVRYLTTPMHMFGKAAGFRTVTF